MHLNAVSMVNIPFLFPYFAALLKLISAYVTPTKIGTA
jgi:hypothetical protein